ncbi:hypothetical protein [Thermococcus sp.]
MKEKGEALKERLRKLQGDPLWRASGCLMRMKNLSERDEWGVVEWESE